MRALHILASIREHSCLFVAERPQPQNPLAPGEINATTSVARVVYSRRFGRRAARVNNSRHTVSGIWLRYFFKGHKSVPHLHSKPRTWGVRYGWIVQRFRHLI